MKPRSAYTITTRPGFICLVDQGEGRSLTNDAEAVVADLARAGYDLTSNRVIYRDTRGIWDELLVRNGAFSAYNSINETDLDEAMATATAQIPTLA